MRRLNIDATQRRPPPIARFAILDRASKSPAHRLNPESAASDIGLSMTRPLLTGQTDIMRAEQIACQSFLLEGHIAVPTRFFTCYADFPGLSLHRASGSAERRSSSASPPSACELHGSIFFGLWPWYFLLF